jgi:transcriptional regulator with XRE-family HTH domain
MMISADQAREARKLLGWPLTRLASKCQIGVTSIRNFENGKTNPTPFKVQAIRRALEAAGIEFDDKEHGVRMREGRP